MDQGLLTYGSYDRTQCGVKAGGSLRVSRIARNGMTVVTYDTTRVRVKNPRTVCSVFSISQKCRE